MELGDKATVAVLVFDQPFGDGFFVHGKKTKTNKDFNGRSKISNLLVKQDRKRLK